MSNIILKAQAMSTAADSMIMMWKMLIVIARFSSV